jgi:hypothetical protein
MVLDRTKIPSVCKILKEKKFDNAAVSAELRYLTLSLLKDIMLTPLEQHTKPVKEEKKKKASKSNKKNKNDTKKA